MRIQKVKYFKPQFGNAHGLFGCKHLKRHNMRDPQWTINDLIEQYERINAIYAKDNQFKMLQYEREEAKQAEDYERLKIERKDKIDELQKILKGDVQRTKNILINFPLYMKVYQNKQSYEVLEELDFKTFHMRKSLDRYMRDRERFINEYESRLYEVAQKQEMIRYYDIKEFQQERDVKRILVELKNSETRRNTIKTINMTYKFIIDQLFHDSLFYQPVLEALNNDWNEQTILVQQTFNIGYPAIKHVKKMKKDVARLERVSKKEKEGRFTEIFKTRQILKEHPKLIKQFIRRDSDFMPLGDRYIRETASMTEVRENVEKLEKDIKLLKTCTLSKNDEEILKRSSSMLNQITVSRKVIQQFETDLKNELDDYEKIDYVRHLLLDDYPEVYKEELLSELKRIDQAINCEREAQKVKLESTKKLENLIGSMRFAMQHILEVLRHIGTDDFYIEREYPNELLELPLLRFNSKLPEQPKILQWDFENLIEIITTKVNILMEHYDQMSGADDNDELLETRKMYQNAVIDDF